MRTKGLRGLCENKQKKMILTAKTKSKSKNETHEVTRQKFGDKWVDIGSPRVLNCPSP